MVSRNCGQPARAFLSELRQALLVYPPISFSILVQRMPSGQGHIWLLLSLPQVQECVWSFILNFEPFTFSSPSNYSFTEFNSLHRPKHSLSSQIFSGLRTEVTRRELSSTWQTSSVTPQSILHKPADSGFLCPQHQELQTPSSELIHLLPPCSQG